MKTLIVSLIIVGIVAAFLDRKKVKEEIDEETLKHVFISKGSLEDWREYHMRSGISLWKRIKIECIEGVAGTILLGDPYMVDVHIDKLFGWEADGIEAKILEILKS